MIRIHKDAILCIYKFSSQVTVETQTPSQSVIVNRNPSQRDTLIYNIYFNRLSFCEYIHVIYTVQEYNVTTRAGRTLV